MKASRINAGSDINNDIESPEDFVKWFSAVMFSAEMADDNSTMIRESNRCMEESKKIINNMHFNRAIVEKTISTLKEQWKHNGGYCLPSSKQLDYIFDNTGDIK